MRRRLHFRHLLQSINTATSSLRDYLVCTAVLLPVCTGLALSTISTARASAPADFLNLPAEYGRTIYRINADSPRQLYIVGIRHRSLLSPGNSSSVIRTQMEIYRIGEWLHENVDVNLLLPEGYFSSTEEHPTGERVCTFYSMDRPSPRVDNAFLRERLGSTTAFVNAEMLLMEHLCLPASQVENRSIYNAVRSRLKSLHAAGGKKETVHRIAGELRYLQEVRTAAILEKIPAVIEKEHDQGTIGNHAALFTIGLNHIQDILKHLDRSQKKVPLTAVAENTNAAVSSGLDLLASGYGITIILPHTLAADRELLKMTMIDHYALASRLSAK